jgi:hypothetical protein
VRFEVISKDKRESRVEIDVRVDLIYKLILAPSPNNIISTDHTTTRVTLTLFPMARAIL